MMHNEVGAMYGCEGRYYGQLPEGFENYVWMELIGFDNKAEDFGVERVLQTMGYIPQAFLLLMTSVDFVNLHKGMMEEYPLDSYFCSYAGHPFNDERPRQAWTNVQLKGLIGVLRGREIKVYVSMFDYASPNTSLVQEHPELKTVGCMDGRLKVWNTIYMTKRFADGTYYEDYFLKKGIELMRDYGFDGIHLADGVCRPRLPLQWTEYSDDMLGQAGIRIPENCDRSAYILQNYRREWLFFCTDRWMGYLKKVINGFHEAGFSVIVNSTWTRDPMESIYRYGVDYNLLATLPIHAIVVENGGPTLELLDDDAMAGYRQSYSDRKLIHHYLRASLLMISACVQKRIPLRPLFPVRDTMEQYDVIHHLPTALQR